MLMLYGNLRYRSLNTNRQYKTNDATTIPNAAPTSLYCTIYYSINNKTNNIIRLIIVLSYTRTIINMSTIKAIKIKSLKDLLLSLNRHLKKQNLDRRISNSQQSIIHIIFGDRNVVQMF